MWLVRTAVQVTLSAPIKAKNKPALKERDRERELSERCEDEQTRGDKKKKEGGWCLKHKTEAGKKRWGNNEAREEGGRSGSHRENVLSWRAAAAAATRLHLRRRRKWRATDKHSRCQVLTPARWPCALINCLETESLRSHFSHALLHHMKCVKLLFRAAASPIDPCGVLTSARGSQEWYAAKEEKKTPGHWSAFLLPSPNNNLCQRNSNTIGQNVISVRLFGKTHWCNLLNHLLMIGTEKQLLALIYQLLLGWWSITSVNSAATEV